MTQWPEFYVVLKYETSESIITPPGRDACLLQGYPQHYVAGTNLYNWVERKGMELSILSKETTRWQGPGYNSQTFRPGACFSKLPITFWA